MTIGEKIKHLRQKNDTTQEKLAEYLNISYQAISKWENNYALPDTSLLVPLANFFNVTIDELFDRDADQQTAEIEKYYDKSRELSNKGNVSELLLLWREAVQKYPRHYGCLNKLAIVLYLTLSSTEYEEFHEANAKETIAICERILQDCTDNSIRNSAIQLLVLTYSREYLSIADEEKAVEYANMTGSMSTSTEFLLEHAYFTAEGKKKAIAQKHHNNLRFMDCLCCNIYLAPDQSPEEQVFACETAIKLWSTLIYDDNFLFYHCRMADIYERLARSYAKLNKREETLESLKKAIYHADRSDTQPSGEQNFTSVFVSSATSNASNSVKNYTETQIELVQIRMREPCFDFVRDDPTFVELQNFKK